MNTLKQISIILLISFQYNLFGSVENTYIYYGLKDGLPSENIYDVKQDSDGFIWVASETGLSRFNGFEFTNFGLEDGLPRSEVVNIEDDGHGNLWLNLSGPFSYYNEGKFYSIPNSYNDISWNFDILVNQKGNTWLSSRSKLYLVNKDKNSLIENQLTKREYIQLIDAYNDTCLIYNNLNHHLLFTYGENIVDSLSLKNIEDFDIYKKPIFCFDYPYLFYISDSTLSTINIQNRSKKQIADNIKKGSRLLIKVDSTLLFKDDSNGFTRIELDKNNNLISRKKELDQRKISKFFVDEEKNLWVCSFDNGLFFYPAYFKKIAKPIKLKGLHNKALNLVKILDDAIWIASRENKVIRLTEKDTILYTLPIKSKYRNNKVIDIEQIDENTLLFATDLGLFTFQNNRFDHKIKTTPKKIYIKDEKIILNTYVNSIEFSRDYLHQTISKTKLIDEVVKDSSKIKILMNGRVYTSIIDNRGNYWFCTYEKGLVKITQKDSIYFNKIDKLFNATIVDIININENLIALASTGNGIFIIDTKNNKFLNLTEKEHLVGNVINSIYWFKNTLYAASNKGLSIITGIDDIQSKLQIENFNQGNGLLYNQIIDLAVDKKGIHLVGQNGYRFISKKDLNFEEPQKKLVLESIKVNGTEIDNQGLLHLKHDQNHFQFKFLALSFATNLNLNYAYKIKEIENDWNYTKSKVANYPNLEPGKYTFEVGIVQANNSKLDEPDKKISFQIKPHFSQSNWFKILYFLLFLVGIYLIANYREKLILKKLVKKKTHQLQSKIRELANTNIELKKSNQDLIDFAYICSHDLKTPLRNINSFTHLLYKKHQTSFSKDDHQFHNFIHLGIKKMFQIIDDLIEHAKVSNDKTTHLVNINKLVLELMQENQELLKKHNAQIIIDIELPTLLFNYTHALQLFLNLIHNAIKYNDSEIPIVQIGYIEKIHYYEFYVKDNGIGIEPEYFDKIFKIFNRLHTDTEHEGTGIGLAICKRIVEKFKGKIWVESEYGKGSTFYFTILKSSNPKFKDLL